ncbi:circadian clock protein KaiC [Herbidospora sp. NEAU-GS84]|uniref:non-specific serine/threonine protein kinase n=1 Tax=Herbidospora solisilvae TaxID=2696284 RepID=A0A7C9NFQ9_9ACTN|nr:circadian clock protein KaiC [Herbidospora solisilvae]NAS23855.1 circadian clock protein KaiC [Herbidospora solisilvae]
MTDRPTIQRILTGISGFDDIAVGGLPASRSTLVSGTTGSGKTLFALEFLARGISGFDQPGVFITFDERPGDLRVNARSLGFDIARWEAEGRWMFVDASLEAGEQTPTVGTYDLGALTARIAHAVRQIGARRVSLDSLGSVFTRFADQDLVRRELYRLAGMLDSLEITSVITTERDADYNGVTRQGVEEFVFDNVVILRHVIRGERRHRTVEIVKFRGATHRTGEWLFTIDPEDGLVVIPVAFLAPRDRASSERVSTGNTELDAMVGGGVFRDAVVLLIGSHGGGKTLAALQFADAAYRAGERCLFHAFDETRGQLGRNAAGWGLDLDVMEASGLLRVAATYSEVASVEDHFLRIRRDIADFAPARLVIDGISALERRATPRTLLDFVIALGGVVREREITTLFTSAPTARGTSPIMEIAGITDVTLVLRHIEGPGTVRRAIAVMQTRGSAHDRAIREVAIDDTGMHVGDPYPGILRLLPDAPVPPSDREE